MSDDETLLVPRDVYLKSGIHIGTKFRTKYMEQFIYKNRVDGLSVLNIQKIDERIKDRNIKRIGDYFDSKDKPIEWECLIDKHRWFTSPGNILNNKSGCPICKNKNEKAIHKLILESVKNYTYFKHHKTFLFNNRKYIVDFYIEINNKKYIVEYNGGQHYFSVKLYGGDKAFIKQQKRDQELRDYCKKNDIMLIEIPYYFTKEQRMDEISKIV